MAKRQDYGFAQFLQSMQPADTRVSTQARNTVVPAAASVPRDTFDLLDAMKPVISLLLRHEELPVSELMNQSGLEWSLFRNVLDSLQSKGLTEFTKGSTPERVRLTEKGALLKDVIG
ncbi:winged helix-turn-helix domain-containing protein [Corallococcus sp. M34]|uniref:winged helix-turn-helix domain-containing protein n=1 Tax=Citreicoccus inhibens TaxID=2849499 RepID=UPI001C2427F3|nr:winged helix-turn-helix domain-containing protein [Citreicoccus inhibens]MBU8900998.1 winged helix-turn-helix domain-containing protein [Citreicoccus inhibens]